jgi:hypothetical protein
LGRRSEIDSCLLKDPKWLLFRFTSEYLFLFDWVMC